eukprot:6423564-Pyramimonas_sp.AAC.1
MAPKCPANGLGTSQDDLYKRVPAAYIQRTYSAPTILLSYCCLSFLYKRAPAAYLQHAFKVWVQRA